MALKKNITRNSYFLLLILKTVYDCFTSVLAICPDFQLFTNFHIRQTLKSSYIKIALFLSGEHNNPD